MKPILGLCLLAALAACAPRPPPPADPLLARCQRQADDTKEVRDLLVRAPSRRGDPQFENDLAMARRKAVDACLTGAGHPPRGGVEPVNRAHYGLGYY